MVREMYESADVVLRLLHTADWQLGKAFAKFPEDAAVHLREQRISTVKKLAAIAAEHCLAPNFRETNWSKIHIYYKALEKLSNLYS